MSEHVFTDDNFEKEVLESKKPVLVDLYADWCGPCKILSPLIEELAKEYKGKGIKIGKLNVDGSPDTATKYHVMSIPTLLFFKDGEVVEQMVGVQSKEDLKKKIEEVIG